MGKFRLLAHTADMGIEAKIVARLRPLAVIKG
jgi:hypothetical protein